MGFSAWQSRAVQCLIYKSIWELGIRFLKVISHPGDVPNPPAPTFLFNMSEGAPGWSWSLQGAHKYWQGSDSFFFFVLEDSTIRPPNSIGSPGEAVIHPAMQGISQDSLDREDQR